jgi:hypothetical protein
MGVIMSLGKLLYEANGKQTALRILDANGSLESSGNDNGKFKDPDLKCINYWTVNTRRRIKTNTIN